ncbi:heme exporter protein CcmB, partial [Marinobacter salarius]
LLSLDRLLALDYEDGTLDLLLTAPLPLEAAVSVKALAHWLTTGLPLVLAAPLLGVLLNLPPSGYGWLVVSLALGTPALSVIGTFGAA